MRTILTYGTFDLFHFGHLELLRRARALGDRLIVGVSTDEFNEREKGKRTFFPYAERAAIVRAVRYVDEVIPETRWEQKVDDVIRFKVDVFVIGSDWTGRFDALLGGHCRIVYLPRTEGISSSGIKRALYESSKRQETRET